MSQSPPGMTTLAILHPSRAAHLLGVTRTAQSTALKLRYAVARRMESTVEGEATVTVRLVTQSGQTQQMHFQAVCLTDHLLLDCLRQTISDTYRCLQAPHALAG